MRMLSAICIMLLSASIAAAAGHITSGGAAPTADCGTVVGTDSAGVVSVTIEPNPTLCVLTFDQAWHSPPPVCLASFVTVGLDSMLASQPIVSTTTTTAVFHYGDLIGQGGQLYPGHTFSYLCIGH